MTPMKLFYYSVVGVADLFVVWILFSALMHMIRQQVEAIIRFWFAEQERYMRRMAGLGVPDGIPSMRHDA